MNPEYSHHIPLPVGLAKLAAGQGAVVMPTAAAAASSSAAKAAVDAGLAGQVAQELEQASAVTQIGGDIESTVGDLGMGMPQLLPTARMLVAVG
jgi:hypothetical protein